MTFETKYSDAVSLIWFIFFLVCLNCFIILRDFFSTLWFMVRIVTQLVNAFATIAYKNHEGAEADGKRLSIGEVRTVMESLQNLGEMEELLEQEPSKEEMKKAFDVFDENGDGFIDSEELKKALAAMADSPFSEQESERMIGAFDCNGDGRIDFQEFLRLTEQSF